MWNKLPCDKSEIKDVHRNKYRRSNQKLCKTKDDLADSLEEGKKKMHQLTLEEARPKGVTKAMENELITLEQKCWDDPECNQMAQTLRGYPPNYAELRGNLDLDCSLCDMQIHTALFMQVQTLAQIGFPTHAPTGLGFQYIEMIWACLGFKLHMNLVSHFIWSTDKKLSLFTNALHALVYMLIFGAGLNFLNNNFQFNSNNGA